MGNTRVVGSIGRVTSLLSNDGHGLDTDHSLQGQVGLVANPVGQLPKSSQKRGPLSTHARDPAKSSVEIWFAGYSASSIR
jgi:hypothetical protein